MNSFEVAGYEFSLNNFFSTEDLGKLHPVKAEVFRMIKKHTGITVKNGFILDGFHLNGDAMTCFNRIWSTALTVSNGMRCNLDDAGNPKIFRFKYDPKLYHIQAIYESEMSMRKIMILAFDTTDMEEAGKMLELLVDKASEARQARQVARKAKHKGYIEKVFLKDGKLENIVKDFELFIAGKDLYNELGIPWKRGYLFYGPPGNGKTLTLRALSRYFGLNLMDATDCVDPHNGKIVMNERVPEVGCCGDAFGYELILSDLIMKKHPKERLPELYYLEDLEKVVSHQSVHTDTPQLSLSSLLRALDGVDELDGVIFVGTTNNISDLAEAIVARPGRFDMVVEFAKPDRREIVRFLDHCNIKVDGMQTIHLAEWLKGLSMAFVAEFVKICKLKSMSDDVERKLAEEVLDDIRRHNGLRKDLHDKAVGFGKDR